jgi:hypothetical protein
MRVTGILQGRLLSAQSPISDTIPDPIDVGVLAVLDGEDTRRQWQPLLDGLSQAPPHRQLRFHPLAPSDMERQLGAARLDFVITNPGLTSKRFPFLWTGGIYPERSSVLAPLICRPWVAGRRQGLPFVSTTGR